MLEGAMLVWFVLTGASLLIVLWDSLANGVTSWVQRAAWILVTFYTGPVGLVLYLLTCRRPFPGGHDRFTAPTWKQAVNSEMHCLAGDATGIMVAAAIVPAFSLLGVGLLLLGLSPTVAGAVVSGVVMGVGNGMSAGTMLTLGGDLAPPDSGPFLSALGMMQDLGVVLGPLIVGWLADAAGLEVSAIVLAVVMFVAIAWIVVVLGDTAKPTRPWIVRRTQFVASASTSSMVS